MLRLRHGLSSGGYRDQRFCGGGKGGRSDSAEESVEVVGQLFYGFCGVDYRNCDWGFYNMVIFIQRLI